MPEAVAKTQLRLSFFEYMFGDSQGYLCLALANRGDDDKMRSSFRRLFFDWPSQKDSVKDFIEEHLNNRHIWFSVHLFRSSRALKENAVNGRLVYADLDECDPNTVEPHPSVVLETSPGRFHAVWKLNTTIPPVVAADYSRRIAYKYNVNGADLSGWDIGQLLRVPYTLNFKYEGFPEVEVKSADEIIHTAEEFEVIPQPVAAPTDTEFDQDVPELQDPEPILQKYRSEIRDTRIMDWYLNEPDEDEDWSRIMWAMENKCLEVGMTPEETFSVVAKAKCNKYERDRRPIRLVWLEIQKANLHQTQITVILGEDEILRVPEIAPEPATETILDKYQEWAENATDALPVYHELSGFMVLSSLLSANLRVETADAIIKPNLWGMILGSSTITRKSTAMNMARRIISYFDETIEIASEGSMEGILQELSNRPRLASMFYRDELSGFLNSAVRKDYMSGIIEMMTNLYDEDYYKRTLKNETVHVHEPVFLFFGGGVAEDIYNRLDQRFIGSGFIPRFLIVSGEPDKEAFRPTGPPKTENINRRDELYRAIGDIYHVYNQTKIVEIGDKSMQHQPLYMAELTDDAWKAYQDIEIKFTEAAANSSVRTLAEPMFGRLHKSCLKMGILLAASRQEPNGTRITCKPEDIINAAYYIQKWGEFTVDMVYNAGKTDAIRTLDRIREYIMNNPGAIHSTIMRRFHLSKRQMDEAMDTLLDRGEITKKKLSRQGGGSRYWPT
jgi:uncharacterized protein DUF3987